MQNKLIRLPTALFVLLIILVTTLPAYAAAEKTITQEYYFEADNPGNLSYSVDQKEIEVDGKFYRLKDISCELYSEPITEKKSLKSKNKHAEPYITRTIEGTEFKLYAPEKIDWKENTVELKQEYKTEAEAPQTVTVEDKELTLKSLDAVSRVDPVSTTAYFYSDDPDVDEYEFNGKTVILNDGRPVWDGYKDDYADYLGIQNNNNYSITGSSWNGSIRETENGYVRTATIYGTKKVNYVIASYGLGNENERYTADVTYTSKYIGHATVTYEKYLTTRQKLVYAGVGIGILALLITALLFILKRRNDDDEDNIPETI